MDRAPTTAYSVERAMLNHQEMNYCEMFICILALFFCGCVFLCIMVLILMYGDHVIGYMGPGKQDYYFM